jgi:ubiquinone/menaquinone biosynthesis C-methylase UbiE
VNLIEHIHGGYAHKRRVHILSELLAPLIPKGAEVLDVGCGDGLLAHSISKKRPDIAIRGVDVFIRESTHVPVEAFDGKIIPYPDGSFDAVMFVDVLHHTEDPIILLREATRVGRRIIIKDHLLNLNNALFG